MPSTTRTFVALPIPEAPGQKLTQLQAQLQPEVPGARWTATLPFHLTLAFLGDVPDGDLARVCTAVQEAAAPFRPFEARLEGLGAFPHPGNPRVVWAGLTAASPDLHELQRAVVRGLKRVGYRPADDRFTPHVTLARIKGDRGRGPRPSLAHVLEPYKSWSGGSFRVAEIVVFASTLTREGPVYAPLAKAALAGRNADPTP